MIDLRVSLPRGTRIDRLINPRAVAWAEAQALNRTRNNAHTEGLKQIALRMGIDATKLRKRGRSSRSDKKFGAVVKGRNAGVRRLETAVIGRGRPFNAFRWNGQPVVIGKRVVATTHEAYGRQQIAKRTWILKSGAIVVRDGASFRGVFGPGVGQMMLLPRTLKALTDVVNERFPHHFSQAIDFAFSSGAPRWLR